MHKPKQKKIFDHLDYYLEHEISPVRQNIDNLNQHLQRRGSLYNSIGIPKILIEGKSVLEVGPGSGHNSLYVSSCNPMSYDFLEPNEMAWGHIEELYSETSKKINLVQPRIIKKKLEDFDEYEKYDVVICEGWLGVNENERGLMQKLGGLVKSKGLLVVTLSSPIGYFSNIIRRILSWNIVNKNKSLSENTNELIHAFGSHLNTMKDMSRFPEDWVQDTLLSPSIYTLSPTPAMFIEDVGDSFSIYGSYPKINSDWRWYKSLYGSERRFNEIFLEAYYRNIHNFFDYNLVLDPRDKLLNLSIEESAFNLINIAGNRENNSNMVIDDEVKDAINEVFDKLIEINPYWAKPLNEVSSLIERGSFSIDDISNLNEFKKIFGRELMYVSAIKE